MKNLCKRERMNKVSKRERKNEKKGKRMEKRLFEEKYFERHQNRKREENNRKDSAENRQKTWLKIIELDLLIYFFHKFFCLSFNTQS